MAQKIKQTRKTTYLKSRTKPKHCTKNGAFTTKRSKKK